MDDRKMLETILEKVTNTEERLSGLETKVEGVELNLAEVKEKADRIPDIERKADVITKELVSVREDMTMVKGNTDEIEGEQTYQYTKWGEHDRRISKLERKINPL